MFFVCVSKRVQVYCKIQCVCVCAALFEPLYAHVVMHDLFVSVQSKHAH